MKRSALTVFVLLAVLLVPSRAGAIDNDVQFWPVLTLDHGITEDWGAHLQSRARLDEDVSHFKDWLIRAYVTWNAWRDLHVDFGYDHIGSNDGSNENRFWLLAEHVLGMPRSY